MDGYITIGTKLSTDKFDRQIKELESKIEKEEQKQQITIEAKSTAEKNLRAQKEVVDELSQAYKEAAAKADEYRRVQEKIQESQKIGAGVSYADYMTLDNLKGALEDESRLNSELNKAEQAQARLQAKVQQTAMAYQNSADNIEKMKAKIEGIQIQQKTAEVKQFSNAFKGVQSSIQGAVKKAGMLALSIIGIRSGLALLRRASSELAQYDEQYAANLEYIRFVITQALAPVLRYIVNLAMTLLNYINAIAQAWFGVNLFANGSVDAFKKMKDGASGVGKEVKEIKNQLTGFDEINRLTDASDTGTSAGAGGVGATMPQIEQGGVPQWMQWILDHKDEVIAGIVGIASALVLLKAGVAPLKALGIGIALAGIVYLVEKLKDYLDDPTWENFGGIITGVGVAVLGIGVAIGGLPAIVIGAAMAILGVVTSNWDKIHEKLQGGVDWLKEKSDWVRWFFGDTMANLYDSLVLNIQNALDYFDELFKGFKRIFDGIIEFVKGVFTGDWDKAINGLKEIFFGVLDVIKAKIVFVFNIVVNFLKTQIEKIKGFFTGMVDIIIGLFRAIAENVPATISEKFKNIMNKVIDAVEKLLNKPVDALNGLIDNINKLPGVNIGHLNKVQFGRLATGGIINMPNKGVMLGGQAIGGESGREGVIPLTDAQAMAELGREIGKNVLINLTNITSMNGRVINRELKRISNQQEFAFNS